MDDDVGGDMPEFYQDLSYLPLLGILLEWLRVLALTYIGVRALRAYEARTRARSVQHVLQRRVEELEQVTTALETQMQQMIDADRFTSALLLRPQGGERTQETAELQGVSPRH